MSNTLKDTAKQLANIMMTHLSTLDPKDRAAKIAAGKKVLRQSVRVAAGSSAAASDPSDKHPRGSSSAGIVRLPLAARGR